SQTQKQSSRKSTTAFHRSGRRDSEFSARSGSQQSHPDGGVENAGGAPQKSAIAVIMKDIDRLTLEEKIGQLFWLGFHGPAPDANARLLLEAIRTGGFILSQRNIESFEQLQ